MISFPLLKWSQTLESNLCIMLLFCKNLAFALLFKERNHAMKWQTKSKSMWNLSQISFFGVGLCILSWQPQESVREDEQLFIHNTYKTFNKSHWQSNLREGTLNWYKVIIKTFCYFVGKRFLFWINVVLFLLCIHQWIMKKVSHFQKLF